MVVCYRYQKENITTRREDRDMWWTAIGLLFIYWLISLGAHAYPLASHMLLAAWIVLGVARIIDMAVKARGPRVRA